MFGKDNGIEQDVKIGIEPYSEHEVFSFDDNGKEYLLQEHSQDALFAAALLNFDFSQSQSQSQSPSKLKSYSKSTKEKVSFEHCVPKVGGGFSQEPDLDKDKGETAVEKWKRALECLSDAQTQVASILQLSNNLRQPHLQQMHNSGSHQIHRRSSFGYQGEENKALEQNDIEWAQADQQIASRKIFAPEETDEQFVHRKMSIFEATCQQFTNAQSILDHGLQWTKRIIGEEKKFTESLVFLQKNDISILRGSNQPTANASVQVVINALNVQNEHNDHASWTRYPSETMRLTGGNLITIPGFLLQQQADTTIHYSNHALLLQIVNKAKDSLFSRQLFDKLLWLLLSNHDNEPFNLSSSFSMSGYSQHHFEVLLLPTDNSKYKLTSKKITTPLTLNDKDKVEFVDHIFTFEGLTQSHFDGTYAECLFSKSLLNITASEKTHDLRDMMFGRNCRCDYPSHRLLRRERTQRRQLLNVFTHLQHLAKLHFIETFLGMKGFPIEQTYPHPHSEVQNFSHHATSFSIKTPDNHLLKFHLNKTELSTPTSQKISLEQLPSFIENYLPSESLSTR